MQYDTRARARGAHPDTLRDRATPLDRPIRRVRPRGRRDMRAWWTGSTEARFPGRGAIRLDTIVLDG
jgi:hypothetical protein